MCVCCCPCVHCLTFDCIQLALCGRQLRLQAAGRLRSQLLILLLLSRWILSLLLLLQQGGLQRLHNLRLNHTRKNRVSPSHTRSQGNSQSTTHTARWEQGQSALHGHGKTGPVRRLTRPRGSQSAPNDTRPQRNGQSVSHTATGNRVSPPHTATGKHGQSATHTATGKQSWSAPQLRKNRVGPPHTRPQGNSPPHMATGTVRPTRPRGNRVSPPHTRRQENRVSSPQHTATGK